MERSYKTEISLSQLLSDNALFLHGVPFRVWGKTKKNCKTISVTVEKEGVRIARKTLPVKNGSFDGFLPAVSAGIGYTVTFAAAGQTRTIRNVAFGEVFLAGGQSNMGWRTFQCYNKDMTLLYQEEIEQSQNGEIRMFGVLPVYSDHKKREVVASFSNGWQEANPASVHDFGAIAYFFAKRMWELCRMPVGVVMSCMGGTPIHTWHSPETYQTLLKQNLAPEFTGDRKENRPSCYFNGCIYPLRKFAFSGVLWYQGEGDPLRYAERYAEMIRGWRKLFRKNLPFVDCGMHSMEKEMEKYALCRIDHARVPSFLENTAYTAIGDTGLPLDKIGKEDNLNTDTGIHPYDKKIVGYRTAERYFGAFMGGKTLCASPNVESVDRKENGVLLTFSNVGDGLFLQNKAGFYALTSQGEKLRLVPEPIDDRRIFLPVNVKGAFTIEYGLRFETETGEKPKAMAEAFSVYNSERGIPRYPLDSFRIDITE